MSVCTPVLAPPGPYVQAAAQLPATARLTATPSRAVVVVPGTAGWTDQARSAAAGGARAVVVSRPGFGPVADLLHLRRHLSIPVVVERPLCPPDLTGAPASPHATLVGECSAPPDTFRTVLLEAVGLLRLLAGGPLTLTANDSGPGIVAALTGPDGLPVTLLGARSGKNLQVRVTGLGVVRTELVACERVLWVHEDSAAGRRTRPRHWESRERRALRRALEARSPADIGDLDLLVHDTQVVESLIGARQDILSVNDT